MSAAPERILAIKLAGASKVTFLGGDTSPPFDATEYVRADMSEWQDISTAPKDGTLVDLWGINHLRHDKKGCRITDAKWGTVMDWIGREREDWQHGRGEDFEPTHWMRNDPPPARANVDEVQG